MGTVVKRNPKVYLDMGLQGQDDNFDVLQDYFRRMQTLTVETSMVPDMDLLTFAIGAHYFAVIMIDEDTDQEVEDLPPEETESEELLRDLDDTELAELNIPRPITVEEFLMLSDTEKAARWAEAWDAKKKGSLYDDTEYGAIEERIQQNKGKIVRPGDIDFYVSDEDDEDNVISTDKGKTRALNTIPSLSNFQPVDFISPCVNDHLVNWPEDTQSDFEGPPSSDDDFYSISTDEISNSALAYDRFGLPINPPTISPYGREDFEQDTEPPMRLPRVPEDPIAKRVVREAARRKIDELRAETVHLFEKKKARLARRRILEARNNASCQVPVVGEKDTTTVVTQQAHPIWISSKSRKPIGLVYLTSSQDFSDLLHKGECVIGLYVTPEYRNSSGVTAALHHAIGEAFHDHDCHRIQAVVVDNPDLLDLRCLYASVGFRLEGVRRKAFYSQIAGEWKDVTYLAILATEWIHDQNNMNEKARLLPTGLWEEILSRHEREQEEFIRMEEKRLGVWPGSLKRSSSLETIRGATTPTSQPQSQESGAESESGFTTDSSVSTTSSSTGCKRQKIAPMRFASKAAHSSSESGIESDWDMASVLDSLEEPGWM